MDEGQPKRPSSRRTGKASNDREPSFPSADQESQGGMKCPHCGNSIPSNLIVKEAGRISGRRGASQVQPFPEDDEESDDGEEDDE